MQYGFRPKHSTVSTLSTFADEVLQNMGKGNICISGYYGLFSRGNPITLFLVTTSKNLEIRLAYIDTCLKINAFSRGNPITLFLVTTSKNLEIRLAYIDTCLKINAWV